MQIVWPLFASLCLLCGPSGLSLPLHQQKTNLNAKHAAKCPHIRHVKSPRNKAALVDHTLLSIQITALIMFKCVQDLLPTPFRPYLSSGVVVALQFPRDSTAHLKALKVEFCPLLSKLKPIKAGFCAFQRDTEGDM